MAAKWTFMVYMAGFNTLSTFATKDLQEMRRVGSTDELKIAVFIKRRGHRSAEHIIVGKNGRDEHREELGNVDSGTPATLRDFVRWAAVTAPAEQYALVVWNHGSGWQPEEIDQLYTELRAEHRAPLISPRELGVRTNQALARSTFSTSVKEVLALPSRTARAIAFDDGTGHSLDTIELNHALAAAHEQELDNRIAMFGMDACLMSNLEVAYETRDHVDTVVGSEELEPGDGWPYTPILRDLSANLDMGGAELGRVVVGRYLESYSDRQSLWPATQCAVRTDEVGHFATHMDALSTALRNHIREHGPAKVQQAQMASTYFEGGLVDVRVLCTKLRSAIRSGAVHEAAGRVIGELDPNGYIVEEGQLGPTVEGCGGVTVYFPFPAPRAGEDEISRFYKDLSFAKHGWDEFLTTYMTALRRGV